jgi:anti-sigma B factor antagonist
MLHATGRASLNRLELLANTSTGRYACCIPGGREASVALKISTHDAGGITVVSCSGRIVFGEEAADLREVVKGLLPASKHIVIDLKGVSYIDSGGLGTLVGLYTSARNAGGEIKLANLTQRVHDQLQITKLITVFDCYDSEQAALKAFPRRATA